MEKKKKTTIGINLNLYKVYFVVCFPFMGRVSDKVWVSSY